MGAPVPGCAMREWAEGVIFMRHRTKSICVAAALLAGACASADEQHLGAPGDVATAGGVGADSFGNQGPVLNQSGVAGVSGLPGLDGDGIDDFGTAPASPPPMDPEVEKSVQFELPAASERFVYVANPSSGTVSVIDSRTLSIETMEAGDKPTFLSTLKGTDAAIVLNVGSSDATIIRSGAGSSTTSTVSVVRGANAIEVAPDGKHAVVYFNSELSDAGVGSGSFQDVTVIGIADSGDSSTNMTVGFRPRAVFFSNNGARAFVVTEDGVSILDFAVIEAEGSGIAPRRELGAGLDKTSTDVSITPDGRYALARQDGDAVVRLVDLDDGSIDLLDLGEVWIGLQEDDADGGVPFPDFVEVTDLDLSPDGSLALAVLRNQGAVLKIPIPGGFEDATGIDGHSLEGEVIGSVTIAADGRHALVYTTATNEERITVMDLNSADPFRTFDLRKSILAVSIAPDGDNALIVHKKIEGNPNEAGLDPDTSIDRSYGYSLLKLSTGTVKLQVTATDPGPSTIVPDGSFLFLLFRDDAKGLREVQRVELKSFLVDPIGLGSPPISVGAVPESNRVFVGQEHPDGRITFIDWNTADIQSVTGFELNSRIRD